MKRRRDRLTAAHRPPPGEGMYWQASSVFLAVPMSFFVMLLKAVAETFLRDDAAVEPVRIMVFGSFEQRYMLDCWLAPRFPPGFYACLYLLMFAVSLALLLQAHTRRYADRAPGPTRLERRRAAQNRRPPASHRYK